MIDDPDLYRVARQGRFGVNGSLVFPQFVVEPANQVEKEIKAIRTPLEKNGMDFGFVTSYNAALRMIVDHDEKILYIYREYYSRNKTDPEIAEDMKDWKDIVIKADCAEPKAIRYYKQSGFRMKACKKFKGSRAMYTKKVKRFKKIVCSDACPNTIDELQDLTFAVDKDDEIIEDEFNIDPHTLSAIWYLIFVLKGYGGQNLSDFIKQLNEDRAILIDDAEDGGVDTLTPQMDITALREHYEQLNRDIVESGQSVNKDLDKFGSAPSGVALKFMYSSLDLKCNLMETEFSRGFEMLLYFVDLYLQISGQGDYEKIDVELVFNRDMAINEAEQIQNCSNSQGIVSDETLIAHHPFVSDVEEELEALKRQKEAYSPSWDQAPIVKDEGNGEE